jgi:serine/threonine protein kinase
MSSAASLAVVQPLGRGGYGMVYAAQKIDTGKLYAVKCMGERALTDPGREGGVLNYRHQRRSSVWCC